MTIHEKQPIHVLGLTIPFAGKVGAPIETPAGQVDAQITLESHDFYDPIDGQSKHGLIAIVRQPETILIADFGGYSYHVQRSVEGLAINKDHQLRGKFHYKVDSK